MNLRPGVGGGVRWPSVFALQPLLAPRVLLPLLLLPHQDGGEVSQGLREPLKLPPRRVLPTGVSAGRCHQSAPVIGASTWPQGDSGPTTQP